MADSKQSAKPADDAQPVIVSRRPVMKDSEVGEAVAPDRPNLPSSGRKIEPLGDASAVPPAELPGNSASLDIPGLPSNVTGKRAAAKPANKPQAEEAAKSQPEAQTQPAAKPESALQTEPAAATEQAEPTAAVPDSSPQGSPPAAVTKDETAGEKPQPSSDENSDADDKTKAQPPNELDKAAKEQAKLDAQTTELIDSEKYFLPINSVEKRRSKRFVMLGILLSILLLLTWVDIALDAGIIRIEGLKPVTHFFSS